MPDTSLLSALRSAALPFDHHQPDLTALLQACSPAQYVLIGEASHGTHEFYDVRAAITRELIARHGFQAVAVEADWPDAHRVDRYVRGRSDDHDVEQALSRFTRFPRWMWRNTVVAEFAGWLHDHNRNRSSGSPEVGFYGVDLYSLNASRDEVIHYLERVDPAAARRARERYACFDHFGNDEQEYGSRAAFDISDTCEHEVVQQLMDLQRRSYEYMHRDGTVAEDDFFSAEQNASLVRNAERYYRSMFQSRVSSWNLRDRHMADTIDALAAHLSRPFGRARIVIWAHNSHLGDARATDMSRQGEFNVGQLLRERHRSVTYNIGFTTNSGTVFAASDWGEDAAVKQVRPGMPDSWESLFHQTGHESFLLLSSQANPLWRHVSRVERAIGVVYRPESERYSHYFQAQIGQQFDAVIHIDRTRAVRALDSSSEVDRSDTAETFPSGV